MSAQKLWLADLEAFDSRPIVRGAERRYLCLYPSCQNKSRRPEHQCLNVNTQTGAYKCQRCAQSGKLADFWTEQPHMSQRDVARQQLRRVCQVPPLQIQASDDEVLRKIEELRERFEQLPMIEGTEGEAYLGGRGVSPEIARVAGVRFSRRWMPDDKATPSRSAVVFPVLNRAGELVAAQGRYMDEGEGAKAKTKGPKSQGLFLAPSLDGFGPFDRRTGFVIAAEAPIDALSLALAGYPAVAFCGKDAPRWFAGACFGCHVFLGFDADTPGDEAGDKLVPQLEGSGAKCRRLRPAGVKDWNQFLMLYGSDALADFLAEAIS